jgi:hypothetical protein
MESIRGYITDGTFESRVPELLSQWHGNAERISNHKGHEIHKG